MNIIEALKAENINVRLSCGTRWLYWVGTWIVLDHPYAAKKNRRIYEGEDEEVAVRALTEDDLDNLAP
jgi:hypothetical protein